VPPPFFKSIAFDPPWDRIIELALKLEGLPYGLSVHCGGVVIAENLKERVPVQPAPKGVNIIQWEKDQTEDAGLVKLDLLGNRSLAVIRDCINELNRKGENLSYAELTPLNDPATQKLIANGKTMGCFYIESPATRQLQQKAGIGDFEHMIIHTSIIRPAAHRLINEYVRRLRGESWNSIHPELDRILKETYGIMVYQEDVMKVAMELAGFKVEEADELRRVLSKKHRQKKLKEFEQKFRKGARVKGLSEEQINKIWEMIESFSGYSFCKPHSASYILVSFKSAWLKAHHPAEFMASVISNQGGYYSTFAYLSEARRMGLKILLADINKSWFEYQAEDGGIRVGFMQIKGLERKLVDRIIGEREKRGEFDGLEEFLLRVQPEPEQARILLKARCFDNLEGVERRAELLWQINCWEKSRKSQPGLFGRKLNVPVNLPKLSEREILKQEEEALGFLVSCHPLELYKEKFKNLPITPSSKFKEKIGEKVLAVGWMITRKHTETKNGEPMEFVSFEDFDGIYETIFFPKAFCKFHPLLHANYTFLLYGVIAAEFDSFVLQVEKTRLIH